MQRTSQQNSEYMQVVGEVVGCLIHQLHHPQLSSPTAEEIADWFHQVTKEEVQIAIERLREAKRIPSADTGITRLSYMQIKQVQLAVLGLSRNGK